MGIWRADVTLIRNPYFGVVGIWARFSGFRRFSGFSWAFWWATSRHLFGGHQLGTLGRNRHSLANSRNPYRSFAIWLLWTRLLALAGEQRETSKGNSSSGKWGRPRWWYPATQQKWIAQDTSFRSQVTPHKARASKARASSVRRPCEGRAKPDGPWSCPQLWRDRQGK